MYLPLSWLGLYAPSARSILASRDIRAVAHEYSIHTAEIDSIQELTIPSTVVIGRVLSAEAHPDSDHLSVVQVSCGRHGDMTIVCGAPNIRTAQYVPVALVGTRLGTLEIKPVRLRGVESHGMICSEDELGLCPDRMGGILPLETVWDTDMLAQSVGHPFTSLTVAIPGLDGAPYAIPLTDTILEVDNKFITNRPDLFAIRWNAREFATIFGGGFENYQRSWDIAIMQDFPYPVMIETPRVSAYHAWAFDGVRVDTPRLDGVSLLLRRAGLPTRLSLVDLTNYIMTEIGQPMHAFDADKIVGGIVVRQARAGETIEALDGRTYTLTSEDMVIADHERPIAIAGIMGWKSTAVSSDTVNVVFESACFDPVSVRLTGQRHGLRTDASTRYEKSLDPLLAEQAFPRVLDLLRYFGNTIAPAGTFAYVRPGAVASISIACSLDFIRDRIGMEIPSDEIVKILSSLGFTAGLSGRDLTIHVPSWRATKDISIKEDIVEEIARIYGYDHIPEAPIISTLRPSTVDLFRSVKNKTNAYFSGQGWYEVYHYSFSNPDRDHRLGYTDDSDAVHIANAFSVECTLLRRTMLGGLIDTVARHRMMAEGFACFEIGKVFSKHGDHLHEIARIGGAVRGADSMETLRETVDGYFRGIIPHVSIEVRHGGADTGRYHPNASGTYMIDGQIIGSFGRVHPEILSTEGLTDQDIAVFEIDMQAVMDRMVPLGHTFEELPRYPGIPRELNFVCADRVPSGDIAAKILSTHPIVRDVRLVDTFRDAERIGTDKKSLTFAFTIQDPDRTITDTDALVVQEAIIATLAEDGITLRSI